MSYKTKDFKITFLGITPVLKDETGYLKPQDIVSLSALMTFKGKSVKDLYSEALEKGQDIEKKVKTIIRKSSLRGHASIATTPAICFTYEASKFIDSLMTGMVFSSSLMASGRRTDTTVDDIVYPSSINLNGEAKALYKKASTQIIDFFNSMLEKGIVKDDASKILQYGIYGTGIIAYPIESIIALKKEIEAQGDWMPEEAKMFVAEFEKYLKNNGADLIYASRDLSARNTFPYPNIFKDPKKINIAREIAKEKKVKGDDGKIVDFSVTLTKNLEVEAGQIVKAVTKMAKDKKDILKNWRKLLQMRHEFLRDYNSALQLKVISSPSWRVWGEKKRHRSAFMTPDSLYYAIERASLVLEKLSSKIKKQNLNKVDLEKIDAVFVIPPTVKKDNEILCGYLNVLVDSFFAYNTLIKKYKVKPSDAVFLMPRGVRVDVLQTYDLFNLIAGYYPLRTCSTADTQLRNMTIIEMAKIKQLLIKKGLKNIAALTVTKCHIANFCLEEKNCPIVKGAVKNYDETFHEQIKADLDKDFDERLKKMGKNK